MAGDEPEKPAALEAASVAALEQLARRFGVGRCAEPECMFPRCLAEGCPATPLETPPPAEKVAINVDVANVGGQRVVVVQLGKDAAAASLAPDTAIQLARVILAMAQKAKSPAGLILPG